MKLFICGNGFGLHLGFNTRYSDYYNALMRSQLIGGWDKKKLVEVLSNGKYFSPKITDNWSNLEEALTFDFESYIDDSISISGIHVDPKNKESIANQISSTNEFRENDPGQIARDFTNQWFWSWIAKEYYDNCDRVKHEKEKDFLHNLLNEEDLFINFNYTHSLEDVFDIPQDKILYIHNRLKDREQPRSVDNPYTTQDYLDEVIEMSRKPFQFGSVENSKTDIDNVIDKIKNSNLNELSKNSLIQNCQEIYYSFTKNPNDNYKTLKHFLNAESIDEVVVLGHSIMGIDTPYYESIIVPMLKNSKWILYYHDDSSEQETFLKRYSLPNAYLTEW